MMHAIFNAVSFIVSVALIFMIMKAAGLEDLGAIYPITVAGFLSVLVELGQIRKEVKKRSL